MTLTRPKQQYRVVLTCFKIKRSHVVVSLAQMCNSACRAEPPLHHSHSVNSFTGCQASTGDAWKVHRYTVVTAMTSIPREQKKQIKTEKLLASQHVQEPQRNFTQCKSSEPASQRPQKTFQSLVQSPLYTPEHSHLQVGLFLVCLFVCFKERTATDKGNQ